MENYETRLKKERAIRKTKIERLNNILTQMGFSVELKSEQYRATTHGIKKDMSIYLDAEVYRHPDMIQVSGRFPRDEDSNYLTPLDCYKSINVSYKKTDAQIIKDINNRFMPAYTEALEYVQARIKTSNERKHARIDLMNEIGKVLNLKPFSNSRNYPSLHEYEYNKKIRSLDIETFYNANEIEFKIRTDKETALKIAKLIKEAI